MILKKDIALVIKIFNLKPSTYLLEGFKKIISKNSFDAVCNLAAQAGVRYSLSNPESYVESNVTGFLNILECCKDYDVRNLCFASSSSVYGLNENYPYAVSDNIDHPISICVTKSNELWLILIHTFSILKLQA